MISWFTWFAVVECYQLNHHEGNRTNMKSQMPAPTISVLLQRATCLFVQQSVPEDRVPSLVHWEKVQQSAVSPDKVVTFSVLKLATNADR